MREWLGRVGVKTLFIEPGSPWENGYIERSNGKLRDELLEREAFDTLLENKVLIERWRSDRTVPWDTGPSRRGSPARSLQLRLSKLMGLVYWRAKP